jgi:hypothetical protein
MEKQLEHLGCFETYKNRQVIVNFYDDEDGLLKRDGFYFDGIAVTPDSLTFFKNNSEINQINLKNYRTYIINTDFQNYFTLRNNNQWIEVYFP